MMFIGRKNLMRMSYLLLMSFVANRNCYINGRNVRTLRQKMLKNKLHLVTFHENIMVSL